MDLWAHINGRDYPIAYGASFQDVLGYELDSGDIIIPHIWEALDLKPYDDIWIHDFKPNADGTSNLPPHNFGEIFSSLGEYEYIDEKGEKHKEIAKFYRHMLCWTFNREQVSLADEDIKYKLDKDGNIKKIYCYNYTIQLISETKGLETIQIPNRNITQPMNTTNNSVENVGLSNIDSGEYYCPLPIGKIGKKNSYKINENSSYELYASISSNYITSSYYYYSSVKEEVKKGSTIILPHLNISGICCQIYKRSIFSSGAEKEDLVHPTQYICVRKRRFDEAKWDIQEARNTILKCLRGDYGSIEDGLNKFFSYYIKTEEPSPKIYYEVPSEECVLDFYILLPKKEYSYSTNGHNYLFRGNIAGVVKNGVPLNDEYTDITNPDHISCVCISTKVLEESSYRRSIKTIYEVARQFVDLYSPYIKVTKEGDKTLWEYKRKYSLGETTKGIFYSKVCPEISFSLTNLRDVLNQLFIVADMIPVVKDGVIECMSLSQRKGVIQEQINNTNRGHETYSLSGSDFCDRTIRNYIQSISKDNLTRVIERIPFKSINSPTMTLNDLSIDFKYPIYSIEHIYMCYYKKAVINGVEQTFLCRQDITPLVMLDSVRNLLPRDWRMLQKGNDNIEDLAKCYYSTIGYTMFSNSIRGWGEKYVYQSNPFLNWNVEKTIIENIFNFMDKRYPYGIDLFNFVNKTDSSNGKIVVDEGSISSIGVVYPKVLNDNGEEKGLEEIIKDNNYAWIGKKINSTTFLIKSMFFEVAYKGIISSAIMFSKDYHDGLIVARDNQSSSLSYIESDGVNQKEKVNQLGNATIVIEERVRDIDDIYEIASVRNNIFGNEDEILFKRNLSFFKDSIQANYYLCKDYVLRNYFTSVYSKKRPFSLASYGDSIKRQENRTIQLYFSQDEYYYQSESKQVGILDEAIPKLISFYNKTNYNEYGEPDNPYKINSSYIVVPKDPYIESEDGVFDDVAFACDLQEFSSGQSFIFDLGMIDSVSFGVYASRLSPTFDKYLYSRLKAVFSDDIQSYATTTEQAQSLNDITGVIQNWYMLPIDKKTGDLYHMSFGLGYSDKNEKYGIGSIVEYGSNDKLADIIKSPFLLPQLCANITKYNKEKYNVVTKAYIDGVWETNCYSLAKENICEEVSPLFIAHSEENSKEQDDVVFKGGKEQLSVTTQIECVSSNNTFVSNLMVQLSDVFSSKNKNYRETILSVSPIYCEPYIHIDCLEDRIDSINGLGLVVPYKTLPFINICIPKKHLKTLEDKFLVDSSPILFPEIVGKTMFYYGNKNSDYYIFIKLISINNVARDSSKNNNYFIDVSFYYEMKCKYKEVIKDEHLNNGYKYQEYTLEKSRTMEKVLLYDFNDEGEGYGKTVGVSGDTITENDYHDTSNFRPDYKRFLLCLNNISFVDEFAYIYSSSNTDIKNPEDVDFYGLNQYGIVYEKVKNLPGFYSEFQKILCATSPFNFKNYKFDEELSDRNMYWFSCVQKIDIDTQFIEYDEKQVDWFEIDEDDFEATVRENKLIININKNSLDEENVQQVYPQGSLRLYYKEDGKYKFVFGVNNETSESKEQFTIYISSIDNRSKSVIDSDTGDSTYKVSNLYDDEEALNNPLPKCEKKQISDPVDHKLIIVNDYVYFDDIGDDTCILNIPIINPNKVGGRISYIYYVISGDLSEKHIGLIDINKFAYKNLAIEIKGYFEKVNIQFEFNNGEKQMFTFSR